MKKMLLAVVIASAGLFSCSDNDDNDNQNTFFDYKVGDVWAYKYYNRNFAGQFEPVNSIDTVKIVGTKVFDNKTYFDFETVSYSPLGALNTVHSYNRVNEHGYLVDPTGFVVHPGTDRSFTATIPYYISGSQDQLLGNSITKLYPAHDIEVEGQTYNAYNYEGYFVSEQQNGTDGTGFQYYYSPGIGLVKMAARYLSTPGLNIEYRLVYHN